MKNRITTIVDSLALVACATAPVISPVDQVRLLQLNERTVLIEANADIFDERARGSLLALAGNFGLGKPATDAERAGFASAAAGGSYHAGVRQANVSSASGQSARTREVILFKAAEAALERGYPAFDILSSEDTSSTRSYTEIGRAKSVTSGNISDEGNISASTSTRLTPGGTTYHSNPGWRFEVYLLTAEESAQFASAYDASLIYEQLAPLYVNRN